MRISEGNIFAFTIRESKPTVTKKWIRIAAATSNYPARLGHDEDVDGQHTGNAIAKAEAYGICTKKRTT